MASTPGCSVSHWLRGVRTAAVDDVEDARRHVGLRHHLRQQARRARGQLGGLGDEGVPRGEGGRDLPGEQQQRQVPRRDHRDHAQRLAQSCSSARHGRPGWPCAVTARRDRPEGPRTTEVKAESTVSSEVAGFPCPRTRHRRTPRNAARCRPRSGAAAANGPPAPGRPRPRSASRAAPTARLDQTPGRPTALRRRRSTGRVEERERDA